jgi:tRNA1Val (adenine37-N6)-methyltransferase
MIAQRSASYISAIEPDKISAIEAKSNIVASRWSSRIEVHNISLQEFVSIAESPFDLIITNPPYFSDSLLNSSKRLSMARHNLMLSPEDILQAARSLLSENGTLSIILPYKEGTLFIATASAFGLYCNRLTKVKPTPSKPVRRLLMEFSGKKDHLQSDYLSIERGDRHNYSTEYTELTKDFYLEF